MSDQLPYTAAGQSRTANTHFLTRGVYVPMWVVIMHVVAPVVITVMWAITAALIANAPVSICEPVPMDVRCECAAPETHWMYIDASGDRVGIGTDTPDELVFVFSDMPVFTSTEDVWVFPNE